MTAHVRARAAVLLLLSAACGPDGPGIQAADLVLLHGTVLTMDVAQPRAEAVAIRDGRIVHVGPADAARRLVGPSTRVVDLGGRLVLPGFQDAHMHPVTGGMDLGGCDLAAYQTADAVLARVAECAAALPDSAWLIGSSWDLPVFPEAAPRKEWLDSLVGDRPAYLTAADGHSAWVNSAALARAGINRDTRDPPNGRIERTRGGDPAGTLREDAMELVADVVPPPTPDQRQDGLLRAIAELNRAGVTAVQEASANRALLETYRNLDQRGELNVRVVAAMRADPRLGLAQVDTLVRWREEFRGARVRADVVKFFVDGVIEARTAAMLVPYTDRPGWAGEPNWQPQALDSMVARLVDEGFSIHLHAIGDRAVRLALDAIESAETGRERGARRHQIAHLEVIDPADIPRFHQLAVTANFQPLWAYPDTYIRDLTWPALGPRRSAWLYPIAAVARAGGRLAFGSDWNVSSLVPLRGIEVAVTRRSPDDSAGVGEALGPEQAISLDAALRAYTMGSAYALGLDGMTGSLAPGKYADLIVLEENVLNLAPPEVGETSVLLTLLEGRVVHGSLDSFTVR